MPQDIFYGGENSQVKHIITRVLKRYFQTFEYLLRISTILTVNICQVLAETYLLRSLLHPALTRSPGCVWAKDIALLCSQLLQED